MTFPANYAVIAEDELTYVTGGGVIENVLPAVMTEANWKTVTTNVVKIVGNAFMGNFVKVVLGTVFGSKYVPGGISDAIGKELANMTFLNGAMQVVGGLAAIYTLGNTTDTGDNKDSVGVTAPKL